MARTARRGNVRAIRPGLPIPTQSEEDQTCIAIARLSNFYDRKAYELAQTEPNSEAHRRNVHMAGMREKLPRNNLRLIVTPLAPRAEWFDLAWRRWRIAHGEHALVESQFMLALHLDRYDEGGRAQALEPERTAKRAALDIAILDALRTPAAKKYDMASKQSMIGKREWAAVHRPEWQAIIDEEMERFPTKTRRPRTQEGC